MEQLLKLQVTLLPIYIIYCTFASICISCHFNHDVADYDYEDTTVVLTFTPTEILQIICTTIPIINDMISNEPDEQFSVTLTSASPVGTFGEQTACVTIIDDDRKC